MAAPVSRSTTLLCVPTDPQSVGDCCGNQPGVVAARLDRIGGSGFGQQTIFHQHSVIDSNPFSPFICGILGWYGRCRDWSRHGQVTFNVMRRNSGPQRRLMQAVWGHEETTRFRPWAFASFRAASPTIIHSAMEATAASGTAPPILAVVRTCPASIAKGCRSMRSRNRSARDSACCRSVGQHDCKGVASVSTDDIDLAHRRPYQICCRSEHVIPCRSARDDRLRSGKVQIKKYQASWYAIPQSSFHSRASGVLRPRRFRTPVNESRKATSCRRWYESALRKPRQVMPRRQQGAVFPVP